MTDKRPPLSQVQKLLLCAAVSKLTQAEAAVFAVILSCEDFTLKDESHLWGTQGRRGRPALYPLPFSRQGLQKALWSLDKRGWVQKSGTPYLRRWRSYTWRLQTIIVLQSLPERFRKTAEAETPVATNQIQKVATRVAPRSTRNARGAGGGGVDVPQPGKGGAHDS